MMSCKIMWWKMNKKKKKKSKQKRKSQPGGCQKKSCSMSSSACSCAHASTLPSFRLLCFLRSCFTVVSLLLLFCCGRKRNAATRQLPNRERYHDTQDTRNCNVKAEKGNRQWQAQQQQPGKRALQPAVRALAQKQGQAHQRLPNKSWQQQWLESLQTPADQCS